MTELSLLPPPLSVTASRRDLLASRQPGRSENAPEESASLIGIDRDLADARTRPVRFQVVDGGRYGRSEHGLADNAALSVHRRQRTTDKGRAEEKLEHEASSHTLRQNSWSSFSVPFLAQWIAQEQLQPGLHHPPTQQADRAYRQAGGEPSLNGDDKIIRFSIAV